jgi:DUF1680 family protein
MYAVGPQTLYVNLYASGEATIAIPGASKVKLSQQTEYPWDGSIRITVTPESAGEFDLALRVPGWAVGRPVPSNLYTAEKPATPVTYKLNGQSAIGAAKLGEDGYLHIKRKWQAGDVVELSLPMPVQRVHAHEKVQDDAGKVALMRGPVVYCLEAVDHGGQDVAKIVLPRDAAFKPETRGDLLGGIVQLAGNGHLEGQSESYAVTAVPYYAWANRAKGSMTVWINEDAKK